MQTTGLLLLVVVGGVWGQYGGQGQEQEQIPVTEYFTCEQNEQCVYWQHCHDGKLNTGGVGLIDPRTPKPIPDSYVDPRPCESVGKLCCVDPDYVYPVDPPIDPPIHPVDPSGPCPLHHLCVQSQQCVNGEINISGIGLIDQRFRTTCSNQDYPGVDAVCCKRPEPYPLVTCPYDYQSCRPTYECDQITGTYETTESCYLDAITGTDGICCSPPVVSECSRGRVCVSQEVCTAQGTVNTDGAGIFDVRILDRCDLGGGGVGVCCLEPPPVNPPVLVCSEPNTVCSPTGYCSPDSLSAPNGYTETCYRTEGSGAVGECCLQPPLEVCPADYTCNLPHQCAEPTAQLVSSPSCSLNAELIGVCCTKKYIPPKEVILDVCPHNSVCLPKILCQGNPTTAPSVVPSHCHLSGTGLVDPGVCCENLIPDPDPYVVDCGIGNQVIDQRIKNTDLVNRQANFGEFPWMAIVFFTNQTYKCGASIIDDRWIVTAAHCVNGYNPYDLRVRLGEYQVDLYNKQDPYVDHNIASISVHPGFNPQNLHNDIALLELTDPILYRPHINRICLPPPDRVQPEYTDCIATGWGKDAFDGGKFQVIMKKVILPVVSNARCEELLRKTRLGKFFKLDPSFVCAGGKAGQDACTGDGGGPLMCLNPGTTQYELYGMTAWGIGCGIEGNPGVYVNVPYFINWMYEIMQGSPQQPLEPTATAYQ